MTDSRDRTDRHIITKKLKKTIAELPLGWIFGILLICTKLGIKQINLFYHDSFGWLPLFPNLCYDLQFWNFELTCDPHLSQELFTFTIFLNTSFAAFYSCIWNILLTKFCRSANYVHIADPKSEWCKKLSV